MEKEWEKIGNLISQQYSAALSSAQFATNFKVSLLFAKFQFKERYMNIQKPTNIRKYLKKQKKKTTLEKTMGKASKTHGKRMGQEWKLDFSAVLSSTPQHSAVLNLQLISMCPCFLQNFSLKKGT